MEQIGYTLFRNTELPWLILICCAASALILILFRLLPERRPGKDRRVYHLKNVASSKQFRKLDKNDLLSITLITVIYAVISLWKLGSPVFPVTTWQPLADSDGHDVVFRLDEETAFDAVYAIYGEGDNNSNPDNYQIGFHNIILYGSNDYTQWDEIGTLDNGSVYQYTILSGTWDYRYLWLRSVSRSDTVSEIGVRSADGTHFVKLSVYSDPGLDSKYPASLMIDEQEKLVLDPIYYDEGYFDEVYHPRNAWEIANGQRMYASVHPLLGTNVMALFIRLFGMSPFVWRLPGALAGILMIPVMYAILKLMFEKTSLCTAGCILLAGDFMHLTTSRIGTLEPFSILTILIMFYYMIRYYYTSFYDTPFKVTLKTLFVCGLWMGISIAVKWTACYSAVGLAILLFTNWFCRLKEYIAAGRMIQNPEECSEEDLSEAERIRKLFPHHILMSIGLCFIFFIFIPAIIYCISYLPDKVWKDDVWSVSNVIRQAVYMYDYHTGLDATHPYQSSWYMWIVDARPIWYYSGTDGEGFYHTIACFSNPLLTWAGLAASLHIFYASFVRKDKDAWIPAVGIITALGPWVTLVSRCVFAYHYYPTSVFVIIALVYSFSVLMKEYPSAHRWIFAFLVLYTVIFIAFLPATAGFGTSGEYIKLLEWFPSWYFG